MRQQEIKIQSIDVRVKEMTSTFVGAQLALTCIHDMKIDSIGSVEETPLPCAIKHIPMKLKQAQAKPDNSNPITSMQWKNQLNLQAGTDYNLTGIAITADDSLLLCDFNNNGNLYTYSSTYAFKSELMLFYPYDVAVIPYIDKAVFTLPFEKSIQFINTRSQELYYRITTDEHCYGVCANRNNIYLGGIGEIFVLNLQGSFLNKITLNKNEAIYSVCFNENSQQIIC